MQREWRLAARKDRASDRRYPHPNQIDAVTKAACTCRRKTEHYALRGDYRRTFKPLANLNSFAFDHKELLSSFNCRFNPLRDYLRSFASVAF